LGRERAVAFRHEAAHAELAAVDLADEDARTDVARNEDRAARRGRVEQALERITRPEIEARCAGAGAGAAAGPVVSVVTTARCAICREDRLNVIGERDGGVAALAFTVDARRARAAWVSTNAAMLRIAREVDAGAATFGQAAAVGGALPFEAEEISAIGAAAAAVHSVTHEVDATLIADRLAARAGATAIGARRGRGADVSAASAIGCVGCEVDAEQAGAASLTRTCGVEPVDPCGDAVDGFVRKRSTDRHLCATSGAAELVHEIRARRVARNHTHLSVAERGLFAEELELERARLQVEASGAVVRAVAARIDATQLENLRRHLVYARRARRPRARIRLPLISHFTTARGDERHRHERNPCSKHHSSPS